MRISDWSSDVCSSDLAAPADRAYAAASSATRAWRGPRPSAIPSASTGPPYGHRPASHPALRTSAHRPALEIGRASWRERVCQYVEISEVPESLKKKDKISNIQ